ncbi:malto-oligosyltrehalose trehalohydrolase [Flavisolibacter nicotianae]|uniref:malto-oligosyltrehalose trehalohydrolase n=1 Tax=Flavisolibacter nicotianae TaxID=2364882 RepID=UPI001968CD98|nr:malto-oligosyltrehalose trehalohydrolase [Flavisolibacter nicotianae]
MNETTPPLFSVRKDNRTDFTVWAPLKESMILHLVYPTDENQAMTKDEQGYWRVSVTDLPPDARYFFRPDDEGDFPDLASGFQPDGVHGPSQVVDHAAFAWHDADWQGLPMEDLVLYEVHVGTFTTEGTFEAMIPRLDELKALGINALELMPVAQFPGCRNWGYDGVFPYAVQHSYGGPDGLKKLVDACHQKGIAVFLDVVYNHLGPEGNYFSSFGPYFTNRYCTPWGDAINFDGEWSDGVRAYFAGNAVYWFEQFHLDGLRCDAIHAVYDNGAVHFWELVHQKIREKEIELGRPFHLIAESDLNSPRVVKDPADGGYGFSAQWLDDFHHALYVLLNEEDKDRYYDFGSLPQVAKAYKDGFVHSGEWVKFRKRKHGASSAGVPGEKFVVFNQNHDQVGNRVNGERLCMLVDGERVKLAAAAILLSPYIPLLFMGEEYADDSPFFYFVSHSDPDLVKAVRKGRKEEFKDYGFTTEPPDPQAEQTFNDSKLRWEERAKGHHRVVLQWYAALLKLRREHPALKNFNKDSVAVDVLEERGFVLQRQSVAGTENLFCLFNLSAKPLLYALPITLQTAVKKLDSRDASWQLQEAGHTAGPETLQPGETISLEPWSVLVYEVLSS